MKKISLALITLFFLVEIAQAQIPRKPLGAGEICSPESIQLLQEAQDLLAKFKQQKKLNLVGSSVLPALFLTSSIASTITNYPDIKDALNWKKTLNSIKSLPYHAEIESSFKELVYQYKADPKKLKSLLEDVLAGQYGLPDKNKDAFAMLKALELQKIEQVKILADNLEAAADRGKYYVSIAESGTPEAEAFRTISEADSKAALYHSRDFSLDVAARRERLLVAEPGRGMRLSDLKKITANLLSAHWPYLAGAKGLLNPEVIKYYQDLEKLNDLAKKKILADKSGSGWKKILKSPGFFPIVGLGATAIASVETFSAAKDLCEDHPAEKNIGIFLQQTPDNQCFLVENRPAAKESLQQFIATLKELLKALE